MKVIEITLHKGIQVISLLVQFGTLMDYGDKSTAGMFMTHLFSPTMPIARRLSLRAKMHQVVMAITLVLVGLL